MSQKTLGQVLRQLPLKSDRNLIVGTATADDAAVYRLNSRQALVQTIDFFTPIVDDPFLYGMIAAANALSDVYAMGGRPLTAMNVAGMPMDKVSAATVQRILRGGAAKVLEAGCTLVGGHSIRNPEPIYGLSVTGIVSPRKMITNAAARPGDLLLLTKPLGVGVATTGIKRGLASRRLIRLATRSMSRLNDVGVELCEKAGIRAGTDVTGFGLLGHLGSLCEASGVTAIVEAGRLPVLDPEILGLIESGCVPGGSKENLIHAESFTRFEGVSEVMRVLLADAQTSGGLLLCVPPARLSRALAICERQGTLCAAVIGRIVRRESIRIRAIP